MNGIAVPFMAAVFSLLAQGVLSDRMAPSRHRSAKMGKGCKAGGRFRDFWRSSTNYLE